MRLLRTRLLKERSALAAIVLLAGGVAVGCGGSGSPAAARHAAGHASAAAATGSRAGAGSGSGAKASGSTAGEKSSSTSGNGSGTSGSPDAPGKNAAAGGTSASTASAGGALRSKALTAGGGNTPTENQANDGPHGGGRSTGRAVRAARKQGAAPASIPPGGGISISPGIFEHAVRSGALGAIEVSNTTHGAMAIKVAVRPWLQSRGGEVSPNRRASLGAVRLSAHSFTLAAGGKRSVSLALASVPRQRSLYGAIEVIGLPSVRAKQGVTVAYRVVSSMRLDPPNGAQRFGAKAGGLIEQGSIGHGTLLIAVRNAGNTIVPIGGSAMISGNGHSLRTTAREKAIVPGQTVNVPLTELPGSLPHGRYTVTVHLVQGGHGLGTATRAIVLR
jgi:hypothetical protein